MSKEINKRDFNICDQVKLGSFVRAVENTVNYSNAIYSDLKKEGLGDFLTFDIAMSIIKEGKQGIITLADKVIQEAQSRVLLTSDKEAVKDKYTKFFKEYERKAYLVRRELFDKSELFLINLFTWNDESKQVGLIKGYTDKIKPLCMLEAKDYHYKYMELLNTYVEAKNELFKYHALVFAYNNPTMSGVQRMRGHYTDDNTVFFDLDTLEYSSIGLDKLMLTNIHEPDSPDILKRKF